MDNYTLEAFSTLCAALDIASGKVANYVSHISKERATYLIARSLFREDVIDLLCSSCQYLEDIDNIEFHEKLKKAMEVNLE